MADATSREATYRRLPGRSRRFITIADNESQRLWLSDTHILNLKVKWATEQHRRFHLNEIQAITITQTDRGRTQIFSMAVLTLLLGALGLYLLLTYPEIGLALAVGYIALGVAALTLIGLVVNLVQGKTCVTRIYTAVQTEELRALGRVRPAHRFLEVVTPLIEAAQGSVSAEDLDGLEGEAVRASAHAQAAGLRAEAARIHHSEASPHLLLYGLFLLGALNVGTLGAIEYPGRAWVDGLMTAVLMTACVVALVKQRNTDLPQSLQVLTWVSLIVLGVGVYIGTGAVSFFTVLDGGAPETFEFNSAPVLRITMLVLTGVMTALGALGIWDVLRHRRNSAIARTITAAPKPVEEAGPDA